MRALVRIAGEVNTKSNAVRKHFSERMMKNMRAALGPGCTVKGGRSWGRIHVEAPDRAALEPLSQVFGIASYSPVIDETPVEMEAIIAKAVELFADRVNGKSFAVRCRRGNVPGFKSIDIERDVGSALFPFAAKVDLRTPEVEVQIDVRQEGAFFYDETVPGPEGLPIGVQGKVICLMSGGFDSPLAAWYIMKRGVEVDFLFLNLAGAAYERSVLAITRALCQGWSHGYRPRIFVVPGEGIVDTIKSTVKDSYSQLVLKRAMYKLGGAAATYMGAVALVTGEALGQVSSQTLFNLAAIHPSSDIPVLRPLIGFEKNAIIALTKQIGTYSLSEHVQEYCNLVPKRPVTKAFVGKVDEQSVGVTPEVIQGAWDAAKTYHVMDMDLGQMMTDYLFVEKIPEGATVVDCRSKRHFEHWHYPDSQNTPIDQVLVQFPKWDRSRVYILYCPYGLQSAVVAEKMQKKGFESYSFKGGTKALKQYASQSAEA